jgi:hypothetical protein
MKHRTGLQLSLLHMCLNGIIILIKQSVLNTANGSGTRFYAYIVNGVFMCMHVHVKCHVCFLRYFLTFSHEGWNMYTAEIILIKLIRYLWCYECLFGCYWRGVIYEVGEQRTFVRYLILMETYRLLLLTASSSSLSPLSSSSSPSSQCSCRRNYEWS